ncbi:MAG TPA: hypothetical protein VF599_18340 [Pyrinomonadaceae bacterium]|jgi:hypothetical protein
MLFYFHPGDAPLWLVFLWVIVFPAALVGLAVWGLFKLGVGEPPKSHDEKVNSLLFAVKEKADEEESK